MERRLILMRHAKSSWDLSPARDFDRPLNKRGREAAPAMGAALATRWFTPDLILCSPAARTRETLALILPALSPEPRTSFRERLYLADVDRLMAEIAATDPEIRKLLVLGHNPGIQELALHLADPARSAVSDLRDIEGKFPTAAIAAFALEASDWGGVSPGTGELLAFLTPKRLADPAET
ncbi:MAG: histidine phosphatase family protein [Pseudomonadota bacterium]